MFDNLFIRGPCARCGQCAECGLCTFFISCWNFPLRTIRSVRKIRYFVLSFHEMHICRCIKYYFFLWECGNILTWKVNCRKDRIVSHIKCSKEKCVYLYKLVNLNCCFFYYQWVVICNFRLFGAPMSVLSSTLSSMYHLFSIHNWFPTLVLEVTTAQFCGEFANQSSSKKWKLWQIQYLGIICQNKNIFHHFEVCNIKTQGILRELNEFPDTQHTLKKCIYFLRWRVYGNTVTKKSKAPLLLSGTDQTLSKTF